MTDDRSHLFWGEVQKAARETPRMYFGAACDLLSAVKVIVKGRDAVVGEQEDFENQSKVVIVKPSAKPLSRGVRHPWGVPLSVVRPQRMLNKNREWQKQVEIDQS